MRRVKIGAFDIYPVSDGRFALDGGAMFGVVPKVLWERCCPADDLNRVPLSLTALLIRAQGKNILVDTGLGPKEDGKFHQMFDVERSPTIRDSLKRRGLTPSDIHMVINTHLHFDHAGGNTTRDGNGYIRPAFPKARYVVQRGEFDDAARANERTRASYRSISGNSCRAIRSCFRASPPSLPRATRAAIRASRSNREGRWPSFSGI
jgi:glyoxylase-like metal-dependent hydrolase (beta-lactamase superfamily II)